MLSELNNDGFQNIKVMSENVVTLEVLLKIILLYN